MSDYVEEKITNCLKELNPNLRYQDEAHLRSDFNLDSLDVIGLLFEIELAFNIKILEEEIDSQGLLKLSNLKKYIKLKID